jgi:hypothetical protein
MDVTNGTGEDTQYRTGSGTTKEVMWTALHPKETHHCVDLKGPWTIYFMPHGGKPLLQAFTEPMASVALEKNGSDYRITAIRNSAKKNAA